MITEKIYDTDSHVSQFEAKVVSCRLDEKRSLYAVELDRTAFFAEGGGQAADRGTLDGQKVEDVQNLVPVPAEGDTVLHYVKEPIEEGRMVTGCVDYRFRFGHMQQHSGEHILSGLAYAWKGYHNVGFHLGEDVTTLDFDEPLTQEEAQELEKRANEVVWQDVPVHILYPSREALAEMDYRSKIDISGAVRLVRIESTDKARPYTDLCACCAPHVMRTGEIGLIKIIHLENYKGGVRLTIVCGERALSYVSRQLSLLNGMAKQMTTSAEKLPEAVRSLSEETSLLKEKVAEMNRQMTSMRCQKLSLLSKEQKSICTLETLDPSSCRNLVNDLVKVFEGHVAVLSQKQPGEYQFIIGSRSEDVRPLAAMLREKFGARGGGSAQMVQGSVKGDYADIEKSLA